MGFCRNTQESFDETHSKDKQPRPIFETYNERLEHAPQFRSHVFAG
jgi:hypothetical protein